MRLKLLETVSGAILSGNVLGWLKKMASILAMMKLIGRKTFHGIKIIDRSLFYFFSIIIKFCNLTSDPFCYCFLFKDFIYLEDQDSFMISTKFKRHRYCSAN